MEISSLVDTWLLLRDMESAGERNRVMYLLKSRGMAHSNQLREFLLTERGIDLLDVYVGPEGVVTGTARQALEAREAAQALQRMQQAEARRRDLDRKREAMEARIAVLRRELAQEEAEAQRSFDQEQAREAALAQDREAMGRARHADVGGPPGTRNVS